MSTPEVEKNYTFVQKLEQLVAITGWQKQKIAKHFGITRQYFSDLLKEKKTPGPELRRAIEDYWASLILSHVEPLDVISWKKVLELGEKNVNREKSVRGKAEISPYQQRIPKVSIAKAGLPVADYQDLAGQYDEWLNVNPTSDRNAYALTLEGDSMEPRFHDGDVVIISPNKEPRTGSFVVARFKDGRVIFKKFKRTGIDGKKIILESLNPKYPPQEYDESEFEQIHPALQFIGDLP